MKLKARSVSVGFSVATVVAAAAIVLAQTNNSADAPAFLGNAEQNAQQLVQDGRQIFRFDTFGDEAFWGGRLQLHRTVEQLTPRQALALGLKVDADKLSASTIEAIKNGTLNLDDPSVTLKLIRHNAVLGVVGFFDQGSLKSVGLSCAICHSTVNDSIRPGIGRRLDGLANRDLNVGAIVASAPNLSPVVKLLRLADPSITAADVRKVLLSWGPGEV